MRGGTEHHKMKWGDIVLKKKDEQFQFDYLEYNERAMKTRTDVDVTGSWVCPPCTYATPDNPEKYPVSTYVLHRVKRQDGYSKHNDSFIFHSLQMKNGQEFRIGGLLVAQ